MFFLLSKVLTFIIAPWIWILLLLTTSLLVKKPSLRKRLIVASLIMGAFFSNEFIFNVFQRAWEIPIASDKDLGKYKYAIVLGGMSEFAPTRNRAQLGRGIDRFLQTLKLYKQGQVGKIIFTGGSGSVLHPEYQEGRYLSPFFNSMELKKDDLLIESQSQNTHQNALFTKKMIDSLHLQGPFLLVTSAFHMRRSLGCFKKAGIDVSPYSTDFYSTAKNVYEVDKLFLPKIEVLGGWSILIHEIVGYITYKIMGYC